MLNRDTVLTIGSVIAFPPVSVQYSSIQTSWLLCVPPAEQTTKTGNKAVSELGTTDMTTCPNA